MKLLLSLVGFVLILNHGINADHALVEKLKPYEKYSPYEWTKWLELRPPHAHGPKPLAAAAFAYAPGTHLTDSSDEYDSSEEDIEDDEDESVETQSPFEAWFKRAILPQPPATKADKKAKKLKDASATKKPSIVDVPLDYWGPPPSIAPNVTLPPPPGYWAAKKSMFVSKLFAALAASVLNATGAPELATTAETTTTPNPSRQAILDEIQSVLLSDVARSVSESDESDESSEADEPATTVNPFLLEKEAFLEKLTAAILAHPLQAATPAPTTPKPTQAPKPKGKPTKAPKGKGKKAAKTPKYLKFLPTTTTPAPVPTVEIDYDALAKALLGNKK